MSARYFSKAPWLPSVVVALTFAAPVVAMVAIDPQPGKAATTNINNSTVASDRFTIPPLAEPF
jgi:hypothetical protein